MVEFAAVPERTALIKVDVIHTSHVLRPDGSNMGVLGEVAPRGRDGFFNKGTESAALHKGLVIDPRDILLEKPRYGAFHGTDPELILRARGDEVIRKISRATRTAPPLN